MSEELNNLDQGNVEDTTVDYISAINELKQKTVDRSKYEELRAENKKLLESIVNGQQIDMAQQEPKKTIDELRKDWLDPDATNLQYIDNALKLREALMAEGKPDPFLPVGKQILPTDEDVACANKVAAVLQECVDYAEGDSAVFTNELQRRLVDIKVR